MGAGNAGPRRGAENSCKRLAPGAVTGPGGRGGALVEGFEGSRGSAVARGFAEGGAVGFAGGVEVAAFLLDHAEAIVDAGVVGLAESRRFFEAATERALALREPDAAVGGGAAEGVEGEVIVGADGEGVFAEAEGFGVFTVVDENCGLEKPAADLVDPGDRFGMRPGLGSAAAGEGGGAAVEIDEALAVAEVFGSEGGGAFEGVASTAGETEGAEPGAGFGGFEETGGTVGAEQRVVVGRVLEGGGEELDGLDAAVDAGEAEAEVDGGVEVARIGGEDFLKKRDGLRETVVVVERFSASVEVVGGGSAGRVGGEAWRGEREKGAEEDEDEAERTEKGHGEEKR